MNFSLDVSVPALTVFFQGLLSFFSPCVLPLIPLYIGYLSGGTGKRGADGKIHYQKSKVMIHTLCFVIGVSFAFFALGLGVSALGSFLNKNQMLFARIGGVIIVLFGFYQLGVFGNSRVLGKERRLPFHLDKLAMSPLTALIMGFTFSFAWTPCVGPALTSVLLMAASANTKVMGVVLIGVYTVGFVLPFLAVGLFTTTLLEFFKSHMNVVKYTVKVGGVLMILMGVLMFTGKMNAFTGYLSGGTNANLESQEETEKESEDVSEDKEENKEEESKETVVPAIDFTLKDQFGNEHTLSDYKGKTVFLNFWATWCGPCRSEMPDIQKLYETYETEGDNAVIILGVAAPGLGQEKDEAGIKAFLDENGYTYPTLMDTTGDLFSEYGISSFPTTFMIDREGNVFGYVSGALNEDMMKNIIEQTLEGKRK
ncbi:MAG: redoxin domain-containing protein [Clostridiales bacterium]|nr:redoxin domain-containing protein [Clostridiales bacterium]